MTGTLVDSGIADVASQAEYLLDRYLLAWREEHGGRPLTGANISRLRENVRACFVRPRHMDGLSLLGLEPFMYGPISLGYQNFYEEITHIDDQMEQAHEREQNFRQRQGLPPLQRRGRAS